jgi:Flp pilus assembly protein TadB
MNKNETTILSPMKKQSQTKKDLDFFNFEKYDDGMTQNNEKQENAFSFSKMIENFKKCDFFINNPFIDKSNNNNNNDIKKEMKPKLEKKEEKKNNNQKNSKENLLNVFFFHNQNENKQQMSDSSEKSIKNEEENNSLDFETFTILSKTKKKLISASVLMKPEEFLGLCIISAVGLSVLIIMTTKLMFITILSLPIGFLLPEIALEMKKRKRMYLLNSQLPEALNIISNGLRAGFSFTQAMSVAVKDMQPPISDELSRVLRENTLGKSMDESLSNLAERNEDDDLSMVVTALLIQRQVGGNLSEILDTISTTIRERVRIKGEIKTLTAQGRLSAVIISLLPIVIAWCRL